MLGRVDPGYPLWKAETLKVLAWIVNCQLLLVSKIVASLSSPTYSQYSNNSNQDLSTALMNLARTDFESGTISRPEFLAQVDF